MNDLSVIVSGGTGALGRVMVRELASAGAKVTVPYRNEKAKDEMMTSIGALGRSVTCVPVDLTSATEVQSMVDAVIAREGKIDALLNLTGLYVGGKEVHATTEEEWDFMLQTNLKTAFLCCRSVLPSMLSRNEGIILNVSARPGIENKSRTKSGAYAVSKAGVAVLTQTIADEVKKTNIRVNAIVPSTMDTQENRTNMPEADATKWTKTEDVAKVIMFLISDGSRTMSGDLVPVYGKS
ncbi:MAG TPA: SDR family NAD(P)-dependent oxidoreductase [Methanomassiliicoccales archaeon]|nr:SDR family NAD(P)-dependent oxidoreductase [Methanomassiliicoccales archaeon]